jgi:hypothetical protein
MLTVVWVVNRSKGWYESGLPLVRPAEELH